MINYYIKRAIIVNVTVHMQKTHLFILFWSHLFILLYYFILLFIFYKNVNVTVLMGSPVPQRGLRLHFQKSKVPHFSLLHKKHRHTQSVREHCWDWVEQNRVSNREYRRKKWSFSLCCSVSYMGGGTFVDGVRRWFQRRSTSVTNTSFASSSISINNEQHPHAVLREEQEQDGLAIVEDLDISGLKLIKVPKRVYFPVSTSSMDSHKKVAFLLFFLVGPFVHIILLLCGFHFGIALSRSVCVFLLFFLDCG